jgi:hypothetical protein
VFREKMPAHVMPIEGVLQRPTLRAWLIFISAGNRLPRFAYSPAVISADRKGLTMKAFMATIATAGLAAFLSFGTASAQTGVGAAPQKDAPSTAGLNNPGGRGVKGAMRGEGRSQVRMHHHGRMMRHHMVRHDRHMMHRHMMRHRMHGHM